MLTGGFFHAVRAVSVTEMSKGAEPPAFRNAAGQPAGRRRYCL